MKEINVKTYHFLTVVLGLLITLAGIPAHANESAEKVVAKTFEGRPCPELSNSTGKYWNYLHQTDKRTNAKLKMIEKHHFSEGVENLTQGITTKPIGDINFVLAHFPNHHRALHSAMKYRLRHKKWPKDSKGQPAECYYQNAIAFSPRDVKVHVQYALLQYKFKRYEGALKSYKRAIALSPGDQLLEYNVGLTLTKLKRYKQANEVARKVYATGFPLPGLRNILKSAGQWEGDDDQDQDQAATDSSIDDQRS